MHVSWLASPPAQNLGSFSNTAGCSALAASKVTALQTGRGAMGNGTLMSTSVGSPPISEIQS